ncbi:MAG: 16S rRNA (cytosine(1402)-N(4))-methyltransferase, partial [Omnitrophica WOR_2 bacterium RIFCSPHIGHO2_02_FULL_48_11]
MKILEPLEMDFQSRSNHIPVMAKEVQEYLQLKMNNCVVDFTLGLAGHALLMAKATAPDGRLIGIDRDKASLEVARETLKEFSNRCEFVHDDYRNIDKILNTLGIREVDAMLLDLGISSYQLDNPQRGFSFSAEGPLDMRMDQDSYISAYDLINSLSEKEIALILRNFGEERWHNRIAHHLVEQRLRRPIASTKDLSEAVMRAIPSHFKREKIHPATRTFQAFRIAVNRELESLEIGLEKGVRYLKTGGRMCVIAFHSLEDRIVKQKFRSLAKEGYVRLLTKKPLRPSDEEV